jgi:hypothetical protein
LAQVASQSWLLHRHGVGGGLAQNGVLLKKLGSHGYLRVKMKIKHCYTAPTELFIDMVDDF